MVDIHGNKIVGLKKVAAATKGLDWHRDLLTLWYDQETGKVWLDDPRKRPHDFPGDYVLEICHVCDPMTTRELLDCINEELERLDNGDATMTICRPAQMIQCRVMR